MNMAALTTHLACWRGLNVNAGQCLACGGRVCVGPSGGPPPMRYTNLQFLGRVEQFFFRLTLPRAKNDET